jgi:hypothetical protein
MWTDVSSSQGLNHLEASLSSFLLGLLSRHANLCKTVRKHCHLDSEQVVIAISPLDANGVELMGKEPLSWSLFGNHYQSLLSHFNVAELMSVSRLALSF